MTQWSEMRPWSGGECPVGPDERVRAVFACGETSGFGGLHGPQTHLIGLSVATR